MAAEAEGDNKSDIWVTLMKACRIHLIKGRKE